MTSGSTRSTYSLGQRRQRAFKWFAQGATVGDVARRLNVTEVTAGKYHQMWLERIEIEAAKNPYVLRDVVKNTIRSLQELDDRRAEAAKRYRMATTDANKQQWMKIQLHALEQRNKLLQLFGVKAEYMAQVQAVRTFQLA